MSIIHYNQFWISDQKITEPCLYWLHSSLTWCSLYQLFQNSHFFLPCVKNHVGDLKLDIKWYRICSVQILSKINIVRMEVLHFYNRLKWPKVVNFPYRLILAYISLNICHILWEGSIYDRYRSQRSDLTLAVFQVNSQLVSNLTAYSVAGDNLCQS